jgi:membrane protein
MALRTVGVERLQGWLDRVYLRLDRLLGGSLTLLIRTGLAFNQDDGAVISRSIAYYALFSLFPLLLVLISVGSSILTAGATQETILALVERIIPVARDLVQGNIEQVLEAQSTVGVLALLGLVWSASGVFMAIYRAVNRAWGNPKSQLFWSEKLFGVAVVLIVGLVLLATTLYSTILDLLRGWQGAFFDWELPAGIQTSQLWDWLLTLLLPLITAVTFVILYRTIPRNRVTWRDVWLGGLVAGLSWEAARRLYTWYLSSFSRHSLIYGSVGAIIGFLLWSYLSAMILLLGAEFTAQHTAWRRAGRPIESRPLSQWMSSWSKEPPVQE